MTAGRLHVICERDVGLFSLIQQVVANVPWAIDRRIGCRSSTSPIAHVLLDAQRLSAVGTTVWEYYFEPLVDFPASRQHARRCPKR